MEQLPHFSSTKQGVKPKGFPSRLARKFAGKRIRRSDQFAWRAADDDWVGQDGRQKDG